MRSQSEGTTTDGQHKPRRGREKTAKRWGQVDKVELDAMLVHVAHDEERADDLRFDAMSTVCAALLEGAWLATDAYCAGRISQSNEPLRFACTRTRDGRIVEVFQAYDEGNIDDRGPYAITLRERDWSVFAAARAFVDNVGPDVALGAVRDRNRTPKNTPRARTAELAAPV